MVLVLAHLEMSRGVWSIAYLAGVGTDGCNVVTSNGSDGGEDRAGHENLGLHGEDGERRVIMCGWR